MKLIDKLTPEMQDRYLADRAEKKIEQSNAQKVLRRFARLMTSLGYKRKSTWFSKEVGLIIQVLHVHKYTFGPCFKLHFCIRVLNDSSESVALNGYDSIELRRFSPNLEYQDSEESIKKCAEAMFEAVTRFGEPWFKEQTVEELLNPSNPLVNEGKRGLIQAVAGKSDPKNVERSRRLLGLA